MKHKIPIVASFGLLLISSSLFAQYAPINPDKYPYPSETIDKNGNKINIDGAIKKPQTFKVNHVYHSPFSAKNFNLGKKATIEQIQAWDTDVRPDGKGLPKGSMSVEKGAEVYSLKCAICHGEFGEGVDRFPVLSGGKDTLALHPESSGEPAPLKTLGSYMPYIAPLFWYIQTSMPTSTPKSLSNSEVYGMIGYLLQVNEIQVDKKEIQDDTIIDAKFLKAVQMPNEKGFEYNNLRVSDTKNTRCMKNCINKNKTQISRIITDATIVEPEFGKERYFYEEIKEKNKVNEVGKSDYEASCAGCHEFGIADAPKFGDKEAWANIIKKDFKTVLNNAINGTGAMPPKGGAMDLSDDSVSNIVKYMMNHSK
jgi:cytochrome c